MSGIADRGVSLFYSFYFINYVYVFVYMDACAYICLYAYVCIFVWIFMEFIYVRIYLDILLKKSIYEYSYFDYIASHVHIEKGKKV